MIVALALAGALAMFVFGASQPVAAQTTSSDVTRSFGTPEEAADGTVSVDVTITLNTGFLVEVTEMLDDAGVWNYKSGSATTSRGAPDVDETVSGQISFAVLNGNPVTYTAEAPSGTTGSFTFSGMFAQTGTPNIAIGGTTAVSVPAATNGDNGGGNGGAADKVALSSMEPGAAVQITISSTAAADDPIMPDEQIQVDLSAFSVPDTIADSDISISSQGYRGTPSNVTVSGKKVTLTVPNVKANGDDQDQPVSGSYSIRIKQSAGVKNAASGGSKTVKWQENAPDGAKKEANTSIDRVVKLSKSNGTRGTMITATFKGFANGSATVDLNGAKLAEVMIADNTGTLEIDTTSSKFKANEDNTITAEDAAGNSQTGDGAVFTIKPKAVVDPEESPVSKDVTIKLSDWPTSHSITSVTIGASSVTPDPAPSTDADGKAEFKVMVPADANRGTQTVKVTGTDPDGDGDMSAPSATASLSVGVLSLTVQPGMVVPGQQITIEGSGFVATDTISSVTVGNQTVTISPAAEVSSAGDVVIAINVPSSPSGDGIGSGKKTVSVTATGSGRIAEGSVEIPKATISLDPVTSRRGTSVNVSGSGFPSGDLVQVKYDNDGTFVTVAAGSADASGAVSIDFTVPSYARIGSKHNVEATSVGVFKGVTAKATHETPGAMVSLSTDSIASGERITISGMNFPAFATVAVMEIGGVDVRPVPAPATSIDGDFESTVLVPQLELGNQTVSVRVSSTTITTFLNIGTVAVSRAPADVFAGLGDRLSRVWYLDRASQEWSFYDPAPEFADFNTLDEVSSGQVVQIIVSEGDTVDFQGTTLYAGTNPIALD